MPEPDLLGQQLFDTVIQELLHKNRHAFDGLNKYEKDQLLLWLESAVLTGESDNAVHDMLWEVDYWKKPVSIEQFIEDEYYLGKTCSGLDVAWKKDLSIVFAPGSPVIEWVLCLAGDTHIPLLDGTECTLQELHQRWEQNSESFGVCSINQETGETVPGECTRVTKFAADQLYKITLDDGTSVRANVDHEFVCWDGEKRRLCDLRVGDPLMPYQQSAAVIVEIAVDVVESVYCLTVNKWANFAISTSTNRTGIFSGNTGAIGTGKTTLACVAMSYVAYRLSCLRDPAQYYGLLPDSLMVLGVYSITKKQVADGGYFKLRGFFDSSPYFRNEFPRNMKIDSKIQFTKSALTVIPGSMELHALGLDLFTFCMDEVNFMRSKSSKEDPTKMAGQAYDLYNATYTRMLSRFMRPGGTMPGIMLLMSSRNAQTSFLEAHLRKVAASPPEVREKTYVSDYRLWEVKPPSRFIKPKFRLEVGDRVHPSRILDEGMKARKGAKIIENVPGEFYERFVEDIDQSMRDLAGEATYGLSPLIRDKKSVFDAVSEAMKHPFTKQSITIATEDETLIEDYFQLDAVCKVVESNWVPKLNPNCPRFIHVDIGLTGDCAGIAMGHVAGRTRVDKVGAEGLVSTITQPFIVIDFMLQIVPPVGDEIDLSKIRAFITYISTMFRLAKVSYDGYQSKDSAQILKKTGLDVGLLSVDRDDDAFMALRAALFERRITMYEYIPFIDEVLDLERVVMGSRAGLGKVDHPQKNSKGGKGSKDIADGVAGVVWHCMNDSRAHDASPPGFPLLSVTAAPRSVTDVSGAPAATLPNSETVWDDLRDNL